MMVSQTPSVFVVRQTFTVALSHIVNMCDEIVAILESLVV